MRTRPAFLAAVVFSLGCAYHLGAPGPAAGTVAVRIEVENRTSVPGLSARLTRALIKEAGVFPGVRISAAAEDVVHVCLTEAARSPLSVDELGRPVETRMRLKAEVDSSTFPQVIELDSMDLTSALHRARRSASSSRAEEQAFSSLARAVLAAVVEKGKADASR